MRHAPGRYIRRLHIEQNKYFYINIHTVCTYVRNTYIYIYVYSHATATKTSVQEQSPLRPSLALRTHRTTRPFTRPCSAKHQFDAAACQIDKDRKAEQQLRQVHTKHPHKNNQGLRSPHACCGKYARPESEEHEGLKPLQTNQHTRAERTLSH